MPTITLNGCSPVPLAHYLKALGILRVVSEQRDSKATAAWLNDSLVLNSSEEPATLTEFFLRDYKPSPLLAPWNGGSGFYPKDNDTALVNVEKGNASRLTNYRTGIAAARSVVRSLSLFEKPEGSTKAQLLQSCHNSFPEEALNWLDAVVVMTQDGAKFPPLLGTGGNDGRLEFTNNFLQRICEVMDPSTGDPTVESSRWLETALFGNTSAGTTTRAPIGQFFPGAAGGANSFSGFDAPSAVNPWDYIFMLEGTLLFASASVKRLESQAEGALVFPFCVKQTGVGYASASGSDEVEARCEMWMPLWTQPTTATELQAVFSEGRAQVHGRPARNGIDFAQATVTLGVDRGITSFQRYGFQVRNGLAYFATPLNRVAVRRNSRANLLSDIDTWHDRLRQKAGPRANPAPPASISRALSILERRIVELCENDSPRYLEMLLAELGATERALSKATKWTLASFIKPLACLGIEWLDITSSIEFRLARSISGLHMRIGNETLWFRQHLEPLTIGSNDDRSWANWNETNDRDVVWKEGAVVDSLNRVLERRILRAQNSGNIGWQDRSAKPACLADVSAFLEGRINDKLLEDLIWGLSLVDWQMIVRNNGRQFKATASLNYLDQPIPSGNLCDETKVSSQSDEENCTPSSLYAILRLCLRDAQGGDTPVPLVPAIFQRAMRGDGLTASEMASRRLRASGEMPLVPKLRADGATARRTAAALLFPISQQSVQTLKRSLLKQLKD